jgi:hypothetical protein
LSKVRDGSTADKPGVAIDTDVLAHDVGIAVRSRPLH